jgi:putative endonuclease
VGPRITRTFGFIDATILHKWQILKYHVQTPEWWNGRPACRQAGAHDKNMMVYALKSIDKKYIYVGMTDDLDRRVRQHNDGRSRATKPYRPFKLLYSEVHADRQSARKREKYLKSGVGKEFLKTLI